MDNPTLTHRPQPTKTSCGPTCVAILAGVPVDDVLALLPDTRLGARTRRKDHRANVGEMARLLRRYRMTIDRRLPGWPPLFATALLRVQHPKGTNWHWVITAGQHVYDPAAGGQEERSAFVARATGRPVSFYEIGEA